ncbi:MAG: tetratricopeptide repeat protein [Candidatus Altiarchaeota archaeon]|nr:tetratricopeptide repeat protein [Candidatus Altiarchaeota archaeon]
MKKVIKKSITSLLKSEQRSASDWMKKTKDDMELKTWLKRAQHFEKINDYGHALDAYLTFLELKLKIMKSRPEYTVKDYFKLVPYYIKIGDCHKNVSHYRKEERMRDFSKAAGYYKKAAAMYLELKEYPSANVYFEFASKTYEEVGLYKESADVFREIADMYLKLENHLIASSSYSKVGELYEKANAYDPAYESYTRAAQLSSTIGDINSASRNYRLAADILRKQGKHEDAVKDYISAAELGTEIERYADVAKTYIGVAQNYEEAGNLDNAVQYYIKAGETSLDNDDALAAEAFKNVGRCYQKMKKYVDAINYYKKSSTISSRLGNLADAAENYVNISSCYVMLGDYEQAADSYVSYARYASADPKNRDYSKGYVKAAELYTKLGDSYAVDGKFAEAIEFYAKAAKAYESVQKHDLEADLYLKMGLLEKREDLGDFFNTFTKAAERYKTAGKPNKSAQCFFEINEYLQAGREFTDYAEEQLERGNLFHAAEGFRKAGDSYSELGQKDPMVDRYNKANQTYLKYVEKLRKLGITADDVSNIGEAYLGIAESNRVLGNLLNTKKFFEDALSYFKTENNTGRVILSEAFLSMVSAKLAIQRGDYPLASSLLSTAIERFEESISQGEWDERYLRFLENNVGEARKLLTEVGEKPEISLVIDHSSYSFVDTSLLLNMTVTNHGNQSIKKISFLPHLPEEIKVIRSPPMIEELAAKKSVQSFIELSPKKKEKYRIKPLEVLYQDTRGNKYVKSSTNISIEIVEKPTADYRNYKDAVNAYQKYADTQLKNNNLFHAAEGYKNAANCLKEFALKKSVDSTKMEECYKKAIKAYTQYVDELKKVGELSMEQLKQIADTEFNVADCYENLNDLLNAEKYLDESVDHYDKVVGKTTSERDKSLIRSQINVVNAFSLRVKAKKAMGDKDYDSAKELLDKSINILEDSLGGGWTKEYEDFLRKSQGESGEILNSIKDKKNKQG